MKFSVINLEGEDPEVMELGDYVALRIGDIFDDLADALGRMDLPEDVAAATPMNLFQAEMYLKRAWLTFIGGDVEEFDKLVLDALEAMEGGTS